MMIKHFLFCVLVFTWPECDNVLQPSTLRGEGCNTLSHSGLASVNIQKVKFFPLIKDDNVVPLIVCKWMIR